MFFELEKGDASPVCSFDEEGEAVVAQLASVEEFLDCLLAELIADATGAPPHRPIPWRKE